MTGSSTQSQKYVDQANLSFFIKQDGDNIVELHDELVEVRSLDYFNDNGNRYGLYGTAIISISSVTVEYDYILVP